MKRLLLIPILFLSSCTLPWSEEHSFESDYKRHIGFMFQNMEKAIDSNISLLEKLSPSGYDNSTIRFSGIVPKLGSGEIMIKADAVRQTPKQAFSAEFDVNGFLASADQLFRLEKLTGGIAYQLGSYYFHLDSASISGAGDGFMNIEKSWDESIQKIQPYLGKWISMSLEEMMNLDSSTSSSEKLQTRIILAVEMDIISGGKKLQKILTENSPLRSTVALGKEGDMYRYQVELDQTGSLALADALVSEYSGTGISSEDREQFAKALAGITLSGVLSLSEDDAGYFSFSGQLSGSGEKTLNIDMAYVSDESRLVVVGEGKEFFAFHGNMKGNNSHYTLSVSGTTLVVADLTQKGEYSQSGNIAITPPDDTGVHISYTWNEKKDFSLKVEEIGGDNMVWINMNGKMNEERLQSIIGSINAEKGNTVDFSYSLADDGKITGKISGTKLPVEVALDGHYKKNDILINLAVGGMTTTLTYKKEKDNIFDGSIRFPIGTLTWKGKATEEFYDTLLVNLASPIASASLDMKTIDGWLTGPLQVKSSQTSAYIPSVDIRAKRQGKDFSLQTDIGMSSGSSDKAHFEWDSHIDIRYDKKAEVKIPTEFIPLTQAFSGFLTEPESSFEGGDSLETDFSNI